MSERRNWPGLKEAGGGSFYTESREARGDGGLVVERLVSGLVLRLS